MICIVSGPSCAGKSSLLQGAQRQTVTGVAAAMPTRFPSQWERDPDLLAGDCFVHYNLLRPASAASAAETGKAQSPGFAEDPAWRMLGALDATMQAVVLVASRATLASRMAGRQRIEDPALLPGAGAYPSAYWLSVLGGVDLASLYASWCRELRRCGIPYRLVSSETPGYAPLPCEQAALRSLE